jgi:tetratricopeptide (TPR) repeat protein
MCSLGCRNQRSNELMAATASTRIRLLELLAEQTRQRSTGILTTINGNLKRLFCFENGQLIFAASNIIEEQLNVSLKSSQIIGATEFEAAEDAASRNKTALTAYLLAEGTQPAGALEIVIKDHVRRLLDATLEWDQGKFTFDSGKPDLADEITITIPCAPIIVDQFQRYPAPLDKVRVRIGPPNMRPKLQPNCATALQAHTLGPVSTFLIEFCNGSRELGEVVRVSDADEETTLRAVCGLLLLGILERHREEEAAPVVTSLTRQQCMDTLAAAEGAEYYGLLGLSSTCSATDIRESYFALARTLHPDRFNAGPLSDLHSHIEQFFTKVTEAYNTLHEPVTRADYDRQLDERRVGKSKDEDKGESYLARENYARARLLLSKRKFQDAVQFLENALRQDDTKAMYHLELGRVLIQNPRRRTEAEELLRKSVIMDPSLFDASLALGQLYLKQDRMDEARQCFEEVLKWEPGHIEATAELEQIQTGSTGGFLKGLFGGQRDADPR